MNLSLPCEIVVSFVRDQAMGGIRVYVTQYGSWAVDPQEPVAVPPASKPGNGPTVLPAVSSVAALPNTWIFQASPRFSKITAALRSIGEPVCLVRQHGKEIKPGDKVYVWESGCRGGIIAIAKVLESPSIQPEPLEQLAFIRAGEKFAGDQLRVRLRILRRIVPVISRKYLASRLDLADLSILRCPRGTNFPVTREQSAALERVVAEFDTLFPTGHGSTAKRIVFEPR